MKRSVGIILCMASITVVMFFVIGAMTMLWAMGRSMERASCYRSGAALESCGKPSFIERKMGHYIAHVDL